MLFILWLNEERGFDQVSGGMNMKGIAAWYIHLGMFGFNLFLLNMLWVAFSFLGLFVLGVFPATVALFAVTRKLVMEPQEVSILKLFWNTFKVEFLKANLLGYVISIVGVILYINLRVLQQLDSSLLHHSLMIVTFVITLVYLLTIIYVFPVFVHFELKMVQYLKFSLFLAIGRPIQTIIMIIGLGIVLFLFLQIPGLIPVFGASLISLIIMKIASLSFPKKDMVSPLVEIAK
jgi:uncharacterized membrane protein YesL